MKYTGGGKKRVELMTLHEYLNNFLFPIKDSIISLQEEEKKKFKEYQAAANKVKLQKQKLDRGYEGLEHYRKKGLV